MERDYTLSLGSSMTMLAGVHYLSGKVKPYSTARAAGLGSVTGSTALGACSWVHFEMMVFELDRERIFIEL